MKRTSLDITPTAAEEEEDLPAEAVSTKGADTEFEQASTSAATKCMTHSSVKQPPVKKSRKQSAPSKVPGPFTLCDAKAVFPDKANKASYLHTGVPAEFISQRESGPFTKIAIDKCNYAHTLREQGKTTTECDIICQSRGQTSTHIHQYHLNICVQCYICGHRWWSVFEWKKHMKSIHDDLSEDDWFVASAVIASNLTMKKEITQEQLLKDFEGDDDDDE